MICFYLNEQTALAAANGAFPQFIPLTIVWAERFLVSPTEAKLRAMVSNELFHNHRSWDFVKSLPLLGQVGCGCTLLSSFQSLNFSF
jgi:hypothetical protein